MTNLNSKEKLVIGLNLFFAAGSLAMLFYGLFAGGAWAPLGLVLFMPSLLFFAIAVGPRVEDVSRMTRSARSKALGAEIKVA